MARNQEKAQSMLYRFREAQAAELGLSSKNQPRRPRLVSSVASLRECEKWRAEILRDISRKVSKIQDFGLTDFEVRDLNDEINKLLREKGHWENQIIALGGANYKRGVSKMLDDSGREVPGTRGYKYFGRAKDLPGVKEMFERTPQQEAETESFRSRKYQRFTNLPPEYYGDVDEDDGTMLGFEQAEEAREWKEGYRRVLESLEIEVDDDAIPEIPRPKATSLKEIRDKSGAVPASSTTTEASFSKRPTSPTSSEPIGESSGKRQIATDGTAVAIIPSTSTSEQQDTDMADAPTTTTAATAAVSLQSHDFKALYYSVLDTDELEMPNVPDRAETEKMILAAKKKALRDEYFGSK